MESSERGALGLVRLIALCFIVVGLLDVGLYLTKCLNPHQRIPIHWLHMTLEGLPGVIGIVMLIKARALAAWVAEQME